MKGQVSIEYLAIFAIALIITLPLIIIFITQTQNFQADITHREVERITTTISNYVETVYFMGEPAQKTLVITLPAGIKAITILNKTINFNVTTTDMNYVVTKETVAPISGTIKSFPGTHTIVFRAENNTVIITDT